MKRAACIRTTEALDGECGQSKWFMLSTAITYLCRVMEKRSVFNDEVFSVFHWLVGSELINDNIGDFASILGDFDMEEFRTAFEDEINDSQYFGRTMGRSW